MTADEIQRLEEKFGRRLPAAYREILAAPPFDPAIHRWIYWLYDDPEAILNETAAPLDGLFEGADWRDTFLAIGRSAGGDLYLLDTAQEPAPIYCLSHEDHSIVQEFPAIDAYIAYWQEETRNAPQQNEQARRDRIRTQREAKFAILLIALSILFIFVMLLIALFRHKPH